MQPKDILSKLAQEGLPKDTLSKLAQEGLEGMQRGDNPKPPKENKNKDKDIER